MTPAFARAVTCFHQMCSEDVLNNNKLVVMGEGQQGWRGCLPHEAPRGDHPELNTTPGFMGGTFN